MEKFEYNESLDFQKLPQEFKGIKFYPVLIKEQAFNELVMSVFGIPKNYIKNNIQIMKCSFFKFLIYLGKNNEICQTIKQITKCEDVKIGTSKCISSFEEIENASLILYINNISFNENDFDIIREIILKQEGINTKYIEEYDPELEEFLNIHIGKTNTHEDKIFTLSIMMGKSPEEIGELSFYQFKKLYAMAVSIKTTEIYEPLIAKGEIKLDGNKKFKSYLDPLPALGGRYDPIKMTEEKFFDKIGVSGKNKGILNKDDNNIPLPKTK